MKILAAGCIHNDTSLVKKLAQQAVDDEADIVVLCGDLTQSEQSVEYIIGPFKKRGKQVLFVPGNHETFATAEFLAKKYDAVNLHGVSYVINDIGFFGCGGANCGVFQLSEEQIHDTLHKAHETLQPVAKKIMVTHVHPSDTLMENLSQFVKGSSGLAQAVRTIKPDILLCGHVHEGSGIEEKLHDTHVINVCRRGTLIEV